MKRFFGYIRVSTTKQGDGVSLPEQREAILRYAQRNDIEVIRWFEERETAAKRGRPVFDEMMKLLELKRAEGVLFHKVDRSVRNLHDWSTIGDASDGNVGVHFAADGLDLGTISGRLAGDIQAVVAAHYSRNLREEAKKGFYGRLKQGCYPLPAPVGYLDVGAGKPKTIDPEKGPLVRRVFELYATGKHTLMTLKDEIQRMGLRNRRGGEITMGGISKMLNSSFYIGVIRLRKTQETFAGGHEPLIPKALFDRVQAIMDGRLNVRAQKHDFVCRRLFRCGTCSRSLIGSARKGHVYFRCQTRTCPTTSLREEVLDEALRKELRRPNFAEPEKAYVRKRVQTVRREWQERQVSREEGIRRDLGLVAARLGRLTDAFIDGSIEKPLFEERKAALLMARAGLENTLRENTENPYAVADRVEEFLGLAEAPDFLYENAILEEKRRIALRLTSDRVVTAKNVGITLAQPFLTLATVLENANGGPYRYVPRTDALDFIVEYLFEYFKKPLAETISRYDDIKPGIAA